MTDGNFKVIVVGGGPVGMTAAHILSKAGIDFVVLERQSTIGEDVGASIILFPHGLRVMGQLGLLDHLREISVAVGNATTIYADDGQPFKKAMGFSQFKTLYGTSSFMFNRAHLIRGLYDGLNESDKARVFTKKKVTEITTDDSGVTVRCQDGTQYDGSILVGADGVHSIVRQHMRALALKASPTAAVNDEKPFTCEYKTMWCSFPQQGDAFGPPGTAGETHATDHSIQFLNGHERSWFFLYERLPAPTKERRDYREDDMVAFAERWGHLPLGEKLKVRDVFPQRYHGGMANLEEGVLKHWSWGRCVLVGDAAHKYTPNQGLGFNAGLQDVVALTNELHRALDTLSPEQYHDDENGNAESGKGLGMNALTAVFERYQATRMEIVTDELGVTGMTTRISAWQTSLHWLFDRWISPFFPRFVETWIGTQFICKHFRNVLVLDFSEGDEPFAGSIPWVYAIKGRSPPVLTKS
ncbi:FAD/NAD(P)-binding domain-containing protein [Hypoxylon sp. NC1633]|nr:FAD/NAD(P)-binding domain-containing protein [Hypoxylon sp. NC1633]